MIHEKLATRLFHALCSPAIIAGCGMMHAARAQIALYKSALRPLNRQADVYHVAARPDGVHWDGIEYYSGEMRRGVLYAFRGTTVDEPTHRFRLRGLKAGSRYRLLFQDQGRAANFVLAGHSLMQEGMDVALPMPLSSELIFIEEVP
jgi:Glycosyl hydrolase family 36 C-terminal domain